MLESAGRITRYAVHDGPASFAADEMAYDATIRNLEVMGEAAKHIPDDVRVRYSHVDWRGVAGLRDVIAHAYFALDDATLWRIAHEDVPRLLANLERIERELHPPDG
jgi:uncharacterized protein with HEPN domain